MASGEIDTQRGDRLVGGAEGRDHVVDGDTG